MCERLCFFIEGSHHTYGAHPQTLVLEDDLPSSESSKNTTPLLGGATVAKCAWALSRNERIRHKNQEGDFGTIFQA